MISTIKKCQKVRDHCHYIERFRGAAQKNANDAEKEKTLIQHAILLDLKIINYITNVKNFKKDS